MVSMMNSSSLRLSKVRSKNTKIELTVRKIIYSLGRKYRLHYSDLPGRPDIVFPGKRKIIFVNGCFWHRHEGCPNTQTPKTRPDYWLSKFSRTIARDKHNLAALESSGWDCMVIWECELSNIPALRDRIQKFLN